MPIRYFSTIFVLSLGLLAGSAAAQSILEFDFTGEPGAQQFTPASYATAGLALTEFTRGPGLVPDSTSDSISSRAWPLEFSADAYYEFVVQPVPGSTFVLDALEFSHQRGQGGPTALEIRTNLDGFDEVVATHTFSTVYRHNVTFDLAETKLRGLSDDLIVRIYAYGATNPDAHYRVANVIGSQGPSGPVRVVGDVTGTVVSNEGMADREAVAIEAVYPNPLVSAGTVQISLEAAGPALVQVFDLMGRRVATLAEGTLAAGRHDLTIDATTLAAGAYIIRLATNEGAATGRMMVVR